MCAAVTQPNGSSNYPGRLEALQNDRWRCTVLTPVQTTENANDARFPSLGTAYSAVYTTDTDETKFANLRLIAQRFEGDTVNRATTLVLTQVYETLTGSFVAEVDDVTDYDLNGLKRVTRSLIAQAGTDYSAYEVGVQSYGSGPTLYLARVQIEENDAYTRIKAEYLEPGIVQASTQQEDGGLLLVTFQSFYTKLTPTSLNTTTYTITDLPNLAFSGGLPASLFRQRVENVQGYKVWTVTSMMKSDGSALSTEADNTIHSYQAWVQYEKPGDLDVSSDDGPIATPGNTRWVKALIEEVISTISTMDDTYKPFSVTNWANYRLSYTPADGSAPVVVSKGAHGYLADSSFSGSNTTYAGIDVDSVVAVAGSDPTPSGFYALEDQVIGSSASPAFVTDAGVKWYRKRRVSVVGTFGDYLS